MEVNRYLENKAMDHIDHALGRPLDPMQESYRNYFAVAEGSRQGEFEESPHWKKSRKSSGMVWYRVTDVGRAALRDHLREIGDPHRAYVIRFDGYEQRVIAKSAGKAKYSYWLDLSDIFSELTFADFCKHARVRLA